MNGSDRIDLSDETDVPPEASGAGWNMPGGVGGVHLYREYQSSYNGSTASIRGRPFLFEGRG